MPDLICRRLVALALAYVLALDPVLPALSAAAWIGDIARPGPGEICASTRAQAGSTADSPLDHGRCCPLGCSMAGCAAGSLPASDAAGAIILAARSAPPLPPLRGAAGLARASRANSARAPPRA